LSKKKVHIDDLFKDNLAGDQVSLDGGEWARLSAELQQPKKKRFFWWWVLGAALLVGAASIVLYQNLTTGQLKPNSTAEVEKASSSSTKRGNKAEDAIAEISKQDTETETRATELNMPRVDKTNNEFIIGKEVRNPSATIDDENIELVQSTATGVEANTPPLANLENTPSFEKIDPPKSIVPLFRFEKILMLPQPIALNFSELQYQPKPSQPNMALALSASPFISSQSIQSPTETEYASYKNLNEGLGNGIDLQLELLRRHRNLEVGAGIGLQHTSFQLQNNALTYQLYDSIPVFQGGILVDYLKFNYRDTTIREGVSNPSYTRFTIPLSVGYQKPLNNKWIFTTGITLQPGVLINSNGTSISKELRPTLVKNTIHNLQLGGQYLLGFSYAIKPKWQLNTEATIQTDLLNQSAIENVTHRFTNYGLSIGVNYLLK
jgi:hypothetical protein